MRAAASCVIPPKIKPVAMMIGTTACGTAPRVQQTEHERDHGKRDQAQGWRINRGANSLIEWPARHPRARIL
jgi:hypothetical protein